MTADPYSSPGQSSAATALPPQQRSGLAIASIVCGILSYAACLNILTGIPAVICGHMAKSRIKKSTGALTGGGMATAGLIMGYLSIVISLLLALSAPVMLKTLQKSGVAEITKDSFNLKMIHTAIIEYDRELQKYPDELSQLEGGAIIDSMADFKSTKGQEWTYFAGQSSSSNGNNILIASPEHTNEIIVVVKINGQVQPLQKADYKAAIEDQNTFE